MSNRLSQLPLDVLVLSNVPVSLRLSQLPLDVLVADLPVELRLSQLPLDVLYTPSAAVARATSYVWGPI